MPAEGQPEAYGGVAAGGRVETCKKGREEGLPVRDVKDVRGGERRSTYAILSKRFPGVRRSAAKCF